jgi:molybdenum cofactor synthesis domain-containing protein
VPTAAVIIIGEEILSGKFADENGPYLVRRLRALGVDLRRLVTIGDGVSEIAAEVRRCAAAVDHVFTTGGVGPTHDDRTFEGIAEAFEVSLEERAEVVALLDRFGMERNAMTSRMAALPVGAELVSEDALAYPIVRVQNVWVLPGVPRIMRQKFEALAPRVAGEAVRTARVYADDLEHDVAVFLDAVQRAHPEVSIGSYPRYGEATGRLIVTVEGARAEAVHAAAHALAGGLAVRNVELS